MEVVDEKVARELSVLIGKLSTVVAHLNRVADIGFASPTEAIRFMAHVKEFADSVGEQVKAPLENLYNRMRFTVVPNAMDGEDVTSITVEGVGRVNLIDDVQTQVKDQDGLQEWLTEEGLEDMIKHSVNAQTFSAFIRRRLRDGGKMPPEDVATYKPIVRAQITR